MCTGNRCVPKCCSWWCPVYSNPLGTTGHGAVAQWVMKSFPWQSAGGCGFESRRLHVEVWKVTSVAPPGSYRYRDFRRIRALPATWPSNLTPREEVTLNNNQQHLINHVVFAVDRSGSMRLREREVVKVVDNQVKFLAKLSQDTGQETRVTVYLFSDRVECIIFDTDVLRLSSIDGRYHTNGQTALIDAVIQSQNELGMTFRKYGDHAFLTYIFTDGYENASRSAPGLLRSLLAAQGPEWTVAGLVPDVNSKLALESCGVPKGNISVWDTASATGMEEVATEVEAATQSYFDTRASGLRGTKTLFSTAADAVNKDTIKAAGLQPLAQGKYLLLPVDQPTEKKGAVLNKDNKWVWEIRTFVLHSGAPWSLGNVYYLLDKKERIGGQKKLAVLEVKTGKVFTGDTIRALIGLPEGDKTVAPDFNPEYKIYVQSTSNNRHLRKGDHLLVLK